MRSANSNTNSSNMAVSGIARGVEGEGLESLPPSESMSQLNISAAGSPPGSKTSAGDILTQQGRRSPAHGCAVLRQQNNQLSLSSVEEIPDEIGQRKSHGDLGSVWLDQQSLYQHDSMSVKSLSGLGLGGCGGGRHAAGLAPRSKSQPSTLLNRKCGVKRRREERADERPTLDFCKMMQTAYKENEVERTRQKSRSGNLPSSSSSAHIDLLAISPNPLSNLSSLRKSLPSPSFNFAVTSGCDMSAFNFNTASVQLSPPPSPFIPVSRPGLMTSSITIRPVNQHKHSSQAPATQANSATVVPPYSPFIPVSQSSVQLHLDDTEDVIGGDDSSPRPCYATDGSSDDELAQYMTHNNNNSSNTIDDDDVQDDDDDDDSNDIECAELLNVKQLDIDLEMIENN